MSRMLSSWIAPVDYLTNKEVESDADKRYHLGGPQEGPGVRHAAGGSHGGHAAVHRCNARSTGRPRGQAGEPPEHHGCEAAFPAVLCRSRLHHDDRGRHTGGEPGLLHQGHAQGPVRQPVRQSGGDARATRPGRLGVPAGERRRRGRGHARSAGRSGRRSAPPVRGGPADHRSAARASTGHHRQEQELNQLASRCNWRGVG